MSYCYWCFSTISQDKRTLSLYIIYSIGAIEDLETFDYSPLRGNFGPTSAAGSARPSLSSTHYGLQRQCSARVTRRSAAVEKTPQGRHFHLAGVIWLINVGGAATEEPTAAAAAEYTPGKTAVIVAGASRSTDFPLWAERNRKIVIPPPQASDQRLQTGNRGFAC